MTEMWLARTWLAWQKNDELPHARVLALCPKELSPVEGRFEHDAQLFFLLVDRVMLLYAICLAKPCRLHVDI